MMILCEDPALSAFLEQSKADPYLIALLESWKRTSVDVQVMTTGWKEWEGILLVSASKSAGERYAVVVAQNERALRSLLLSSPTGSMCLFLFEHEWMLSTLEELFEGKLLTAAERHALSPGLASIPGRIRAFRGWKRGSGKEAPVEGSTPTGGKQGKAERRARREEQSAPVATAQNLAIVQIANSKDPLLTQLNDLGSANGRRARSQFLAEGMLLVQRAIEDGQPIDCLVYTSDLLHTSEGPRLLDRAREAGIRSYLGSEGLLGKVTTSRPVPDVMAAVCIRFREAEQFHTTPDSVLLIAENINNPDNLGMILRTADAAGAEAVVVAGADPFHKNCVRAARGAVGRLPILGCRNLPEYLHRLQSQGFTVVGAALGAEAELYRCPLRSPIAVIVGNEQSGIAPETLSACSLRVQIPMATGQDSLNVGVAAGIMLYEIFRQRTTPPHKGRGTGECTERAEGRALGEEGRENS